MPPLESDLEFGKQRQAAISARGCARGQHLPATHGRRDRGPASIAAMHRQGFARWRDVV
jgi:hypothetical protein